MNNSHGMNTFLLNRLRTSRYYRLLQYILPVFLLLLFGCQNLKTGNNLSETFSFIYMSDIQADPDTGDYTALGELLSLAFSHESNPKLLILGGDNVNTGSSAKEWETLLSSMQDIPDDATIATVVGNHDNNQLIKGKFDHPSIEDGFFYTFTEGDIFFLMLDSNAMGGGNMKDVEWLEKSLSQNNSEWSIAVCHHPFFMISQIPKDINRSEVMRNKFLPVLESTGVDLILCGHQHVYARTLPMLNGSSDKNGIVQIMTASGGKESYTATDTDYIVITKDAPVYLIVEIQGNNMLLTAFDATGEAIDSIEIQNRK